MRQDQDTARDAGSKCVGSKAPPRTWNKPHAGRDASPPGVNHNSRLMTLNPVREPRYADAVPEVGAFEHELRGGSKVGSHTEMVVQAEARKKLLQANPELMERRKALAMAAFVRHDTSDMMESMRQVALMTNSMPELGGRMRLGGQVSPIAADLLKPNPSGLGHKVGVPGHLYTGQTPGRSSFPFTTTANIYNQLAASASSPPPTHRGAPPTPGGGSRLDVALNRRHQSPATVQLQAIADSPSFYEDLLFPAGSEQSRPRPLFEPGQVSLLLQPTLSRISSSDGSTRMTLQQAHDIALRHACEQLDASSVPSTPIALRPGTYDFTPDVPGTMNGMGHPLINDRVLLGHEAIDPMFVLNHRLPIGKGAAPGGNQLAPLVIGNIMVPLAGRSRSPGAHKVEHSPSPKKHDDDSHGKGFDHKAAMLQSSMSMIGSGRVINSNPPPDPAANKTLQDDTLNLWRGKRLTLTETKIEARLHRLRHNPVAKTELQDRVAGLLADKAAEAAELAALQLFASERREQKALTFLERQSRYVGQLPNTTCDGPSPGHAIKEAPVKKIVLTGVASLFDPHTGDPVSDHHPLPAHSIPFWKGLVNLMTKMKAMNQCLDAAHWANAELNAQHSSASKIQAGWRGHVARKQAKSIRARQAHLRLTSRKMQLGQSETGAAQLILQFIGDYEQAGRRGAAVAALRQAAAGVSSEKARAQVVRAMRIAILVRQWSAVEAAAIELQRKRTRGNTILGIAAPTPANKKATQQTQSALTGVLAAKKKGINLAMYAEDREAAIKAATDDALSKTFINDRIILEDTNIVPQSVKATIIGTYLDHKHTAYLALVGLVWRARAQWKCDKRLDDSKQAAMNLMANSPTPPPDGSVPVPATETLTAEPSLAAEPSAWGVNLPLVRLRRETQNSAIMAEASGSIDDSQQGTPTITIPGDESGDPGSPSKGPRAKFASTSSPRKIQKAVSAVLRGFPTIPPFRVLATPMELKALMQQGVQEAPIFDAYMHKGQLQGYEAKLNQEILSSYGRQDEKGKKAMVKASKNMQGGSSNISKVVSNASNGGTAQEKVTAHQHTSFTVALLIHRWKTECMPRTHACLRKRYGLLKVDLVECLTNTKVYNHDEVGQQLQQLVPN